MVATVRHSALDSERVETFLRYLETEWASVPAMSAAWANWDEADRLDLQLEWGIRDDRLGQLREALVSGALSRPQANRLAAVCELERRYRPLLETMWATEWERSNITAK